MTEEQFNQLATEWENDTFCMSSPTQIKSHKNFAVLVSFGFQAIPWCIKRLDKTWTYSMILTRITGMFPHVTAGDVKAIKAKWKEWYDSGELYESLLKNQPSNIILELYGIILLIVGCVLLPVRMLKYLSSLIIDKFDNLVQKRYDIKYNKELLKLKLEIIKRYNRSFQTIKRSS
jgi:hypothetical protein